jgi:transketolase
VVVLADRFETTAAMHWSAEHTGPVFLRISRMPVPDVHSVDYQFEFGKAACLRAGDDITFIANGVMASRALDAAEELHKCGVSARVLNMSTVKPIDREAIIDAAKSTRGIVTIEEHSVYGGLGGAVAEVVAETYPVKMRILGIPGVFAPTGSAEFILEHFGLTADGIRTAALQLLQLVRAE